MNGIDIDLDKMEAFRDAMDKRLEQAEKFVKATSDGGSLVTPLPLGGGSGDMPSAASYSTDEPTATWQCATRATGYWNEELQKLYTMSNQIHSGIKALRDAADQILGTTKQTEDTNSQYSDTQSAGL